jgi:hypothetical protein
LRYGGNKQRFGEARNAHEQSMAAGEQANGEIFDDLLLADDGLAKLVTEGLVGAAEFIDGSDIIGR